jgi:hypothetical protein
MGRVAHMTYRRPRDWGSVAEGTKRQDWPGLWLPGMILEVTTVLSFPKSLERGGNFLGLLLVGKFLGSKLGLCCVCVCVCVCVCTCVYVCM